MWVFFAMSIAQASVVWAAERKMIQQLESYAARIAARIQNVGAEVDPDLLQLPGGSVIATLLWLYSKGVVCLRKH
jgi:hypothetical protein